MTVVDLILRFIKRKPPITVLFSRNGAFLLTYFSGPMMSQCTSGWPSNPPLYQLFIFQTRHWKWH